MEGGKATHRISRLVVPLRSGNSWMSVAPFRELEREATNSVGGHRSVSTQASSPSDTAPLKSPQNSGPGGGRVCLAGSEPFLQLAQPTQTEPATWAFRPCVQNNLARSLRTTSA